MKLKTFAVWERIPTRSVDASKPKYRQPSDPVTVQERDEIDFIVIVTRIPGGISKESVLEKLGASGYCIQSEQCGFKEEFPDDVNLAFRYADQNLVKSWEDL